MVFLSSMLAAISVPSSVRKTTSLRHVASLAAVRRSRIAAICGRQSNPERRPQTVPTLLRGQSHRMSGDRLPSESLNGL